MPSVHVVLHLRPCICSRRSFYWRLLLYKPGSGALSHSQTFFVGWSLFFAELLTTSLVQTERKTQMLGLELSGLIGEHVIHFHFESFLIVCLPKTARGECVWRGLMKACPQYWHVVVCDCECVGVRVWERDQGGVCGRWRAHWFVQCVCIDVWMIVCMGSIL